MHAVVQYTDVQYSDVQYSDAQYSDYRNACQIIIYTKSSFKSFVTICP